MGGEGGASPRLGVRPLLAREKEELGDKVQTAWKSQDCPVSQTDGDKSFTFDHVFHSEDSTPKVYQAVAAPIIQSAVQRYNGTLFAYDQAASGKTHTMLGTRDCPGVLPMAVHDVFKTICKIPGREFLLRISYMEIHNETVQDLLCSDLSEKGPLAVREGIDIIESKGKDTSSSSYEGAVMVSDLGDSGGPLVGGTRVHGIASFNGKRCGSGKYPDVCTQISKYIPWVHHISETF